MQFVNLHGRRAGRRAELICLSLFWDAMQLASMNIDGMGINIFHHENKRFPTATGIHKYLIECKLYIYMMIQMGRNVGIFLIYVET